MRPLFDINRDIDALIDYETGEILDVDALDNLRMERKEKLRNIAFLALNAEAEIAAMKEQIAKFAARKKAAEKTLAWAKETLEHEMDGQKWTTDEFVLSYNPASVAITSLALLPRRFFRVPEVKPPEPVPDKKAIKEAIDRGEDVPGAVLHRTVKLK